MHLCHGNIAIFTWIHGYRWSSHELLMLSWRWCFAIYSPLIFPLWLYCLTVTIGNTFLCYHISHIYTVILCFNAKCWQITVTVSASWCTIVYLIQICFNSQLKFFMLINWNKNCSIFQKFASWILLIWCYCGVCSVENCVYILCI